MSSGVFVDGLQERLASASKQPEELGRIAPDGSVTLNWNVIAACAQNWKPGVLDNSGFAKLLLAARVTQPAQAAQSVPGVNKAVQLIPGMTKEQFAYVHHCALEVDAAKAETARLLAENAALKAQAAQGAGAAITDARILELAEPFGCFEYGDAQGDKRIEFARAILSAQSTTTVGRQE